MKRAKIKRVAAVALSLTLGMSMLVGCGDSNGGSTSTQEMSYNLMAEVKTVDPALNNANDGSIVITNAFEGLYKMDEDGETVPGVAESVDISDDGLVYTFHLREDAKWSDGEQVTANDFKYAWTRVLNPETAADYAFQLYYIKGGEEYNTGSGTVDQVGINVIDDTTLEVTLAKPTSYFLDLTSTATYMPEREDKVEADPDGWTTNPDEYVSNGPFKLEEYNMKDSYVLVKNDNYYDKDNVKLDKLTFKMITDETSSYASVKNGELTGADTVPISEIASGQEEGYVKISPMIGTYYYELNVGNNNDSLDPEVNKALSNKDFRKALNLAIDRKKLVEEVTKGGQIPAYSFVSQGIKDEDGNEFTDKEYWDAEADNTEEAKEELAKAGYPNGEGLPTFELLYNSTEGNKVIAEALQQMWSAIGVNVTLKNEEWAVFQDTRTSGNYEIARAGWLGDYEDPMTFLDVLMSGNGNNDTRFSNTEYDSLLEKAQMETDAAARNEYMREAEDILMDEMPVIPLYYYTSVKAFDPKAKGIVVNSLGNVYFEYAYMEE